MTVTLSFAPSHRNAIFLGAGGLAAACLLLVLAPAGVPLALVVGGALLLAGGGMLAAVIMLDRLRREDFAVVAQGVGDLHLRLTQAGTRIDSLSQRFDMMPMPAQDAAPARASIAELTAEVGILGGLLKEVAQTLTAHDAQLHEVKNEIAAAATRPAPTPAPPAPRLEVAPVLRPAPVELKAEPDLAVQASQLEADAAQAEAILSALAKGQIEVHLQPVVQLPQRRSIGYEAFVRLRLDAETLLLPAEFMQVVEARGLGPTLDALVLTRVLAIARYLSSRPGEQFVSCNISPATWASPRAVASIARLVENYRAFAHRLVLEMPQRVFRALDPTSLGLLGSMSAFGARFALDQLGDLRLDPTSLADRGVRIVKAPAGLMAAADEGRVKLDISASDFAPLLERAGVLLVAEKIEDDRTAAHMIELNIGYAQGLLFAPPRPARAEIFAEPSWTAEQNTPPTAAEMAEPQAQAQAAAAPERVPFRAALRKLSA